MGKLKTDHWSRFGRFKRKGRPPASNKFGGVTNLISGRLACDLSSIGCKVGHCVRQVYSWSDALADLQRVLFLLVFSR